jgi:hypothetical protein
MALHSPRCEEPFCWYSARAHVTVEEATETVVEVTIEETTEAAV